MRLLLLLFISIGLLGFEVTTYVNYFGLAYQSDTPPKVLPIPHFRAQDYFETPLTWGSVVFVKTGYIPLFYKKVLPRIGEPIILLIADGDHSFPSFFEDKFPVHALIESEKILHIFATNSDYKGTSEKVSPLPIGIDFHSQSYRPYWGEPQMSPKEQEKELEMLLTTFKPTALRKKRAFVDFQFSDTMRQGIFKRYLEFGEDRQGIFERLRLTHLIDYTIAPLPRKELWKRKGEYAFSISPHGNGLDTHRTWEDLILGCIVIVKTSPLDPLYEGLPVVIVQDWGEVTEANLDRWLVQYHDAFTNPEYRYRLTTKYWIDRICKFKGSNEFRKMSI